VECLAARISGCNEGIRGSTGFLIISRAEQNPVRRSSLFRSHFISLIDVWMRLRLGNGAQARPRSDRQMAFEVEIKFRTEDQTDLAARLTALGARKGYEIEQEDLYLAHPARDFGASREAMRLRSAGQSNWLTYKGPRHEGPTKTRTEIEIAYAEGA